MDGTYQFSLPLRNDLEPVWDFRIGGQIVGPVLPESVACPSHPEMSIYEQVAADARGNGWDAEVFGGPAIPFELVQHAYEPDVPLRLRFRHDSQGTATLQTYRTESLRTTQPHSEQGSDPEGQVPFTYFRIELPPPALDAQATAPLDLLVLADTSGAVRERPEVDEVVERLIDYLRPEDRVRLVCVDVVARPVHDGWLAPESVELAAARKRFADEFCLGESTLLVVCAKQSGRWLRLKLAGDGWLSTWEVGRIRLVQEPKINSCKHWCGCSTRQMSPLWRCTSLPLRKSLGG